MEMSICTDCGRTVADRAPCMSCPTEHRGSRPHMVYRDDGTGCRRCGEFHPDCSPCRQSPEDAALDRKQVLDAERDPYLDLSIVFQEADGALVDAFYFLGTLSQAIAHGKETAEAYGCPRFKIHPYFDPENILHEHGNPTEHRGSRALDALRKAVA